MWIKSEKKLYDKIDTIKDEVYDMISGIGSLNAMLNDVTESINKEPIAAVAIRIRFHLRSLAGTGSS